MLPAGETHLLVSIALRLKATNRTGLLTTTLLFLATAMAEIVGCYLPYLWLKKVRRLGRSFRRPPHWRFSPGC